MQSYISALSCRNIEWRAKISRQGTIFRFFCFCFFKNQNKNFAELVEDQLRSAHTWATRAQEGATSEFSNFCFRANYLYFCSYEGTGRSLSLKLIQQLRQQSADSQQSMSAENRTTNTARLSAGEDLSCSPCLCSVHLYRVTHCCVPVSVCSSFSPRGFSARVHSVLSGRPCREVAEWAALSRLPQHSQAHFRLPASTNMWTVSFVSLIIPPEANLHV